MMDSNNKVVETLSINKWNTDTVQEFFETHLMSPETKDQAAEEDYLKTNRV